MPEFTRDEHDDRVFPCPRRKRGEYNWLKCVRTEGHKGECNFVVDTLMDDTVKAMKKPPAKYVWPYFRRPGEGGLTAPTPCGTIGTVNSTKPPSKEIPMTEATTTAPTKQEQAEAATKAKIAAKEQKLAEAKAKKEAADKARAEKAEARAKAQAEAKAKQEEAKANAEAAKKAKAEERAAKAAEKAANPGTTLGTIVERAKGYIKGPNGQLHSGDELAMALESVPANKVVELILAIFKEPNKYAHLNYGQQSMNYRNRLRGAISKGTEIEGVKITLDYVKQVRDDGNYVPSEEAEAA